MLRRWWGPLLCLGLLAAVLPACKGPRGPVVLVHLLHAPEAEVLADFHEFEVTGVLGGVPISLNFPEGGPRVAPVDLPADLNMIVSGSQGSLGLIIIARDVAGVPVARGVATVDLRGPRLYEVNVEIGVTSTCHDTKPTPLQVREVCFFHDTNLILGDEMDIWGNIGNGMVFADFDATGGPDILAAWAGDFNSATDVSGVSMFPGTLEAGVGTTYTGGEIVIADTTRRGNLEVAVTNFVGTTGPDPDNFNDVIVAARENNELTIWPGRGDNTFETTPLLIPVGAEPGEIRIGDLLPAFPPGCVSSCNEIALGLREAGQLLVIAHEMIGMAPTVVASATVNVGPGARGFTLVDMNGDGLLDIVVAAKGVSETMVNGQLTVHINDGIGGFATTIVTDQEIGLRDVAAYDMDGDGDIDLATVNEETGELAIWRALSPTSFEPPDIYLLYRASDPASEPERLRLGDMDGDMVPDLVACERPSGSVFVVVMGDDGIPAFPPVRVPAGPAPGVPGEDLQGCDIIDSDGDGVIDLVAVVDRAANEVRLLRRDP